MSARFFSPVSPAKNGCSWHFYFREVDTWLLEVHFYARSISVFFSFVRDLYPVICLQSLAYVCFGYVYLVGCLRLYIFRCTLYSLVLTTDSRSDGTGRDGYGGIGVIMEPPLGEGFRATATSASRMLPSHPTMFQSSGCRI